MSFMNQVHMDTLLAIVEEGSFEVAAAVLGVSPSAVSQRIKSLESETGRVLLRRTSPVTPTQAGEILVQTARRMALVQEEARVQLGTQLRNVPLSVAVNADSLHTWFRAVIGEVAQVGEATLRLRIEDETATLGMLRRGDVMGAVTNEPAPVAGCESSKLGTMRYYAMAAPNFEVRDWREMPLVVYAPGDPVLKMGLRTHGIALGEVRGRVSQVPDIEAYNEAVRVGLGWGMIPVLQAEDLLESGELVIIDEQPVDLDLYWQRWRLESDMLGTLTDIVHAAAAQLR